MHLKQFFIFQCGYCEDWLLQTSWCLSGHWFGHPLESIWGDCRWVPGQVAWCHQTMVSQGAPGVWCAWEDGTAEASSISSGYLVSIKYFLLKVTSWQYPLSSSTTVTAYALEDLDAYDVVHLTEKKKFVGRNDLLGKLRTDISGEIPEVWL